MCDHVIRVWSFLSVCLAFWVLFLAFYVFLVQAYFIYIRHSTDLYCYLTRNSSCLELQNTVRSARTQATEYPDRSSRTVYKMENLKLRTVMCFATLFYRTVSPHNKK
jgi:hypothetical protein